MGHNAITVSIERTVDPARLDEATVWIQAGINLANKYPGFLGSGWVRSGEDATRWHMLYRFSDATTLDAWENSPERRWWLGTGSEFAHEDRTERRTGIEGWFDTPISVAAEDTIATVIVPPRWKQAVSIWVGFFPLNLAFTLLAVWLIPGWEDWGTAPRVLASTLVLTPIMAYWGLPTVTRILRPWLQRPPRQPRK
ncbi:antibiotic biosynthesis monooxygenase [Mycetocola spongiae]|uniref:antibiotic biosynthesis monooxygenase n=1 Tax=Mycetocola spongiae TaxID=2859226 RepID=UPI001CF39A4A|nr:antibiotic biosynthesis monooxygenase [Mycetocola spongiae]UCR88470.1 antibiotic biosynthesis monooxygenase [Mycetocola spongiae]